MEIDPDNFFALKNYGGILRGLELVTGKDLRKHFSGRPSIITTGIQLYESLGEEDTGYGGDVRVANEWARILGVSDWFTWREFEDVPESYFTDA